MTAQRTNVERPAMTAAQQQAAAAGGGGFAAYKRLQVGEAGLLTFILFELYNVLFAWLPSALGYVTRRLFLRTFFERAGAGLVVGKNVNIRNPGNISLGDKVVIEDDVSIESRVLPDSASSVTLGSHVFIGKHTIVCAKPGNIVLGNACNISSHCRIATQSRVHIGESVLIAAYVYIGPGNHQFDDVSKPIMEQGMAESKGVTIGDDVWIGTRATILDGVSIGSGAIVGAHSLVASDVPENAIVAGVPAKVLRYRTEE